jgi:hypothetical protein
MHRTTRPFFCAAAGEKFGKKAGNLPAGGQVRAKNKKSHPQKTRIIANQRRLDAI